LQAELKKTAEMSGMHDTMLAAVLYGKEHVQLERVPVPGLGPGDLLVRVRAALTCGTDVKVFQRGYHARMIMPPALFGHELAGDIVAVGSRVRDFELGQRIVAANSAPCLQCFYCRRGRVNLCEDLLFNNGAYAEFIRIPSRIVRLNTYVIPPHLDYRDAALAEPLACVVKGVEDSELRPGDTVAVIGVGSIGSMFIRLAKLRGARVIAVGRRRSKLQKALRLGADRVVATEEVSNPVAAVRELTGGHGADIVIEAVGKAETWNWSVEMLRRGGTVNFFGGPPHGTRVDLDTHLLHYSEITCKASFHHTPATMREALDIIASGGISALDFVNAEEPLENLSSVLFRLAEGGSALKTAIIP
jgi:L-iditol 2-dehydrogenase